MASLAVAVLYMLKEEAFTPERLVTLFRPTMLQAATTYANQPLSFSHVSNNLPQRTPLLDGRARPMLHTFVLLRDRPAVGAQADPTDTVRLEAVLRFMVGTLGCNPDLPDCDGRTPLWYALQNAACVPPPLFVRATHARCHLLVHARACLPLLARRLDAPGLRWYAQAGRDALTPLHDLRLVDEAFEGLAAERTMDGALEARFLDTLHVLLLEEAGYRQLRSQISIHLPHGVSRALAQAVAMLLRRSGYAAAAAPDEYASENPPPLPPPSASLGGGGSRNVRRTSSSGEAAAEDEERNRNPRVGRGPAWCYPADLRAVYEAEGSFDRRWQ